MPDSAAPGSDAGGADPSEPPRGPSEPSKPSGPSKRPGSSGTSGSSGSSKASGPSTPDGPSTPSGPPGGNGREDGRTELEQLRERVAVLEAARAESRPRRHVTKSFLAALFIVIGCVLAPFGAVSAWASSEVGDTERYVDTVAPLASDPDVQAAVANRAANAVMGHLDLPALLEEVAPADRPRLAQALGRLGGPLEDAIAGFVRARAQDVVASEVFKRIWIDANRTIHSAVDKALTGSGGGAVKIKNDSVSIDLAPVIDQLKQRLVDEGLTVAAKIPEVHTDFTVLRADNIGKVKTGFRLLQIAGFWLPVLSVLLVAAGVLLSVRRRRALVAGALGLAVATLLLGLGLTVFRVMYLNALPDSVSQPAAASVYDALTHYLRTTIRTTAALGVVIALGAWLSGPGRVATLVRQLWNSGIGAVRSTADRAGLRTGPVGPYVHRYRAWITWALVAAAVLSFVLWSYPTGWVVLGIALVLLFALAVVEFLAEDPSSVR